jgi:hypothetical protein
MNSHNKINIQKKISCTAEQIERDFLLNFGERIVDLGIRIVASQKLIHPLLQTFFIEKVLKFAIIILNRNKGILPLERISFRHLEAVQIACGAKVLSSMFTNSRILLSYLGYVHKLEEKEIQGKK